MPEISHASVDLVLCYDMASANAHGKGGFYYQWASDRKQWPDDVSAIVIVMPVSWSEVIDVEIGDELCNEHGVPIAWSVPRWKLTGTPEKPSLHPSLLWVDVWHGWLRDGRLESC